MRKKNNIRLIKKIMYVIIYIILIMILSIVIIQRFSNSNLSLFGYRIFRVASESMEPEYNVNDVIIVKKVEFKNIKVGDNITYINNRIITHKVIKIEKDSSENYIFHTKGIANNIEDPVVKEEQVYGVVVYKTFLLSYINRLVNNKYGFIILVIIPLIALIYSNINELITIVKEKDDEE